MAVLTFAELTWEDVHALAGARTVAILPLGALEAHGPHLPLATDVVIAEAMARAGAARLSAAGFQALLLPSLAYTAAGYAAGFAGTLSVSPGAVTQLIVDVARSLARHEVGWLALANAHLDPAHREALRAAVEAARGEGVTVIYPDIARRRLAQRLGDEFQSGACHAGRFETSIVQAARRELVREAVRATLPANPKSLSEAVAQGMATFEEAGGPRAYFGFPADASVAEGRATIVTLGEILAEAVLEADADR